MGLWDLELKLWTMFPFVGCKINDFCIEQACRDLGLLGVQDCFGDGHDPGFEKPLRVTRDDLRG